LEILTDYDKAKTYFVPPDCQSDKPMRNKPKAVIGGGARAGCAMMLGAGVKLGPGFKPKEGISVFDSTGKVVYRAQAVVESPSKTGKDGLISLTKVESIEDKRVVSPGQNPNSTSSSKLTTFEPSDPVGLPEQGGILYDKDAMFKMPDFSGATERNRSIVPPQNSAPPAWGYPE
jgi:hypothetical protein